MLYRLLVDVEVILALDTLPKNSRTRLLDHFRKIRVSPDEASDCHKRDGVGRRVEISVFSGHATHYWMDHADQYIKILALKPAD